MVLLNVSILTSKDLGHPAAVYTGMGPHASLAESLPSPAREPPAGHLSDEATTSAVVIEQFIMPPMSPVSPPTSPVTREASPQARQASETGEGPERDPNPTSAPVSSYPIGKLSTSIKVWKRRRSTVYEDDSRSANCLCNSAVCSLVVCLCSDAVSSAPHPAH